MVVVVVGVVGVVSSMNSITKLEISAPSASSRIVVDGPKPNLARLPLIS